ncbi:MAG: thiol peroxidase [Patiriisocius sp.]|jgi:thiol peroxidase
MAAITLKGNTCNTIGKLPEVGTKAPSFELRKNDLSFCSLEDYTGQRVILNIYPSIDTGICAMSTRKFNEEASNLTNTKVLCISKDLPFAQGRFCGAEGIDKIECLSDFTNGSFGSDYNVDIADGPMTGLHSRAIVVLDENHTVIYTEQVPEIVQEPDYVAAMNVLG